MAVFLLFIFSVVSSITPASAGDPYFEFLQLALHNPKAVDKNAKGDFTIHGLWPTNSTALETVPGQNKYISIEFCPQYRNQHFQSSSLHVQLQASLASCWPSYTKDSNNQFWDYEYIRHGTCTLQLYKTPFSYFHHACNLWRKYKVDTWLGNANIPSNAPTSPASVASAIKTGFGFRPVLWCNGTKDGLQEVRLCFDAELKGRDCPNPYSNCLNPYSNCLNQIEIAK